jgi:hypothetical protein
MHAKGQKQSWVDEVVLKLREVQKVYAPVKQFKNNIYP